MSATLFDLDDVPAPTSQPVTWLRLSAALTRVLREAPWLERHIGPLGPSLMRCDGGRLSLALHFPSAVDTVRRLAARPGWTLAVEAAGEHASRITAARILDGIRVEAWAMCRSGEPVTADA